MRVMSLRLALTVLGIAGLVQSVSAENTLAAPSFVEETASAGIDSVYAGEWEYMVGGGVATFDCNSDGLPDVLITDSGGGSHRAFLNLGESMISGSRFLRWTNAGDVGGDLEAWNLNLGSTSAISKIRKAPRSSCRTR